MFLKSGYKLCILLPIHVYLKIQMLFFFLCKDNKINTLNQIKSINISIVKPNKPYN